MAAQSHHYNNVMIGTIAFLINSLRSVYSTLYSDADQRKHQSSAWLAFVWGIHREPVNSPHKWPVTRKMFPFDDVIVIIGINGGVLLHRPPLYWNRVRGINYNRLHVHYNNEEISKLIMSPLSVTGWLSPQRFSNAKNVSKSWCQHGYKCPCVELIGEIRIIIILPISLI